MSAEPSGTTEAASPQLPTGATVALLTGSTFLAAAYGSTALLSLRVAELGGDPALAGGIVTSGTLFTLMLALSSGNLTDWVGRLNGIVFGGAALAASMGILGSVNDVGPLLLVAGALLGTGWALFYVLVPIYVVSFLRPQSRIKYLTLISGFQMLGIGVSPVAGRWVMSQNLPVSMVFQVLAVASLAGCACFVALGRSLRRLPRQEARQARLGWTVIRKVFARFARYPVIMIGLGACIFSALSTFQTTLANAWEQDYSQFFIVFISTVVICRLFLAGVLGRYDPFVVILALLTLMVLGLLLLFRAGDGVLVYGLATVFFAVGYGLAYSVLNGILVNAVETEIQAQALQIFTCSYFLGIFGFPALAGVLLTRFDVAGLLASLVGIGSLELGVAIAMTRSRPSPARVREQE
jgi:hypothetical protein